MTDAAELDRRARERDTTRIPPASAYRMPLAEVRRLAHAANWRRCACPLCGRRRLWHGAALCGAWAGILLAMAGAWAALAGALVVIVDAATDYRTSPGYVWAFYAGIAAVGAGAVLAVYCYRRVR